MRRLNKALIAAAFAISANACMAACDSVSCTDTIKKLYTSDTMTYIQLTNGGTPGNCTLESGVYFDLPVSNPNYKALYATLLTAYIAKQKVQLRAASGAGCYVAYLYVDDSM